MTQHEAEKILMECDEFHDFEIAAPKVILDGQFTAQQIEAVLTLMRPDNQTGGK